MTIKTHIHTLLLIFISLFILACGGGGGGGGDVTDETSPSSTEQQGQFIDSLVIGLRYETPSTSGITDTQGRFSYRDGETVRFYIGDVFIGEAVGQAIVTPVELVNGATDENNVQVQNIVMFLQSIDEDGDESNGITITTNATNTASGQSVDFTLAEGVFEASGAVQVLISAITSSNGQARSMITRTQAKNTFRNNLLSLFAGDYEGTFSGDDTGSWSATVDVNGNINGISTSDTYGADIISGNLSSSGKSSMSGTVGSAVFSGNFSRTGNVTGIWVDDDDASGSFTGARISAPPASGSGSGTPPPANGGAVGSITITGNDANAIGALFVPNLDPVAFEVFNIVTVNWSQSILSATEFESRTMSFRFNNDGSLYSVIYLRTTGTSPDSEPTSYYDYYVDCEDAPQACTSIMLDITQQQVTFNDTRLVPDAGGNNATDAIVLNGSLNW